MCVCVFSHATFMKSTLVLFVAGMDHDSFFLVLGL